MKKYGDNVKWTELYESEEALLSDMMLTCSDPCTAYTWKWKADKQADDAAEETGQRGLQKRTRNAEKLRRETK